MKLVKKNTTNKAIKSKHKIVIVIIIFSLVLVLGVVGTVVIVTHKDKSSDKFTNDNVTTMTDAQMVSEEEIIDVAENITECTTENTTEEVTTDSEMDTTELVSSASSEKTTEATDESSDNITNTGNYAPVNITATNAVTNTTATTDDSTELCDWYSAEQYGYGDPATCKHYFTGVDGEKIYMWEENAYGVHHEVVYETVEHTEEVPIIENICVSQCKRCGYVPGYVLAPGQNSDVPYPWDDFNQYLWVEADTESYEEHVDNSGTEIIILWGEEHEVEVCRYSTRSIGIDVLMGYETITTTEEVLVSEEWTEIIHTGEWYCGHCGAKKE